MSNQTISIAPEVALLEQSQLTEYYRNRNLVLSQTVYDREREIMQLQAELRELRPQADEEAETDGAA